MVTFSNDPQQAEQQMHAIIFYLVTFGYIDGDFDAAEKSFVRDYIGKLVKARADGSMKGTDARTLATKAEMVDKYTRHFHEVFEGIDARIKDLFTEPVAEDEDPTGIVHSKLKLRCFEIFKGFGRTDQEQLMSTIDELIMADGEAHPAELKFRAELASLLESETDFEIELVEDDLPARRLAIEAPRSVPSSGATHPFFVPTEFHYSADPDKIAAQLEGDKALIQRTLDTLAAQRAKGAGKLVGKDRVQQLAGQEPFMDGHIVVCPPKPGRAYDLTVLGDLHGCYSVLKATLLQSQFFEKVDAFRRDPVKNPEPKLILLGDYIDRGLFSLNGVLRTVMQLYVTAPDHVIPLRGNHEYFIEYQGNVYGGVKPAESINTLKPHAPVEFFRNYCTLFDALPNVAFFDDVMFVHGGIPRDRLLKERYKDLSSLNDPDLRFQMMWSDPSAADVIPAELQDKSSRFAFGKLQLRSFLQRIGCHTVIRGHEKVNGGFEEVYADPQARLFTLFSAGGSDNEDLPSESSYRSVTPMALTIRHDESGTTFTPWTPDYKTYNDPSRNAFFQVPPEIEHRG